MSSLFDSDVPLKDITEGLDNNQAETGSRESGSDSSPSIAAYYNGFNSGGRYV